MIYIYQKKIFLLGEWLRGYSRQKAKERRASNSTEPLEKKTSILYMYLILNVQSKPY